MKPQARRAAALIVLLLFIGLPMAVFFFGGDGRDFERSCREKCYPRFSRVGPDPAYPAPATGKRPPLKCECY
jgi:hypothetical protein